jgi:hypothetical protein
MLKPIPKSLSVGFFDPKKIVAAFEGLSNSRLCLPSNYLKNSIYSAGGDVL